MINAFVLKIVIYIIENDFRKPFKILKFRDSIIPPLQSTLETDRVIAELTDIRKRISQGESCLRSSDDRNVWLREPLSEQASKPAAPTESARYLYCSV